MTSPQSAVVFDFGAVLFRWRPLELLQQVWPAVACDAASARHWADLIFQSADPHSDWAQFDLGQVEEEELILRLNRRTGVAQTELRRLIEAIADHLVPMEDSVKLFWRLKRAGHRLFYLSNMPRPYAESLQQRNAFISAFDAGVFSCDVSMIKPDRRLFQHVQDELGLTPQHTLFIDDHPANVEAARQLGWQAVHFVDAAQTEAQIKQWGWS